MSPRPSPPDVFAGFAPHPAALGPPTLLAEQMSVIGSRKKSVNMTECVPVPSSEHVAEIVGRQGEWPPSGAPPPGVPARLTPGGAAQSSPRLDARSQPRPAWTRASVTAYAPLSCRWPREKVGRSPCSSPSRLQPRYRLCLGASSLERPQRAAPCTALGPGRSHPRDKGAGLGIGSSTPKTGTGRVHSGLVEGVVGAGALRQGQE